MIALLPYGVAFTLGIALGMLWPAGRQRWYFGAFRAQTWVHYLPVYVSPCYTGRTWHRGIVGIAVGTFGLIVYVFRGERL